jgi:hypothetical protein
MLVSLLSLLAVLGLQPPQKEPPPPPPPQYLLLEAMVSVPNIPKVDGLVTKNFLPSIRKDSRVLGVYTYLAATETLFPVPATNKADEEKRFVVVVKVKNGTLLSANSVMTMLTRTGKTEAQVLLELNELNSLVRNPTLRKAEFLRQMSIVRTPFEP